ncbi:FadR/GntR family transcriptional regulator [Burkholderia stagnalis]
MSIIAPRLADVIAKEIETSILHGVFKAGDRLPAERQLAEDYGVSRGPLREALKQLAARGLIESRHGGGTFVTQTIARSFTHSWHDLLQRHDELRPDALECRRLLEGEVAATAAVRATDADRARLKLAYAALEAACATAVPEQLAAAYADFHRALSDATNNVFLANLMADLIGLLGNETRDAAIYACRDEAGRRQWLEQHRALLAAVEQGDATAARQALHRHAEALDNLLRAQAEQARHAGHAARRLNNAQG